MLGIIGVLSFVLIFYVMTFGRISAVPDRLAIEHICEEIAVKINSASQYGDGFGQNMTLPDKLDGADYNITVYTNSLVCRSTQDVVRSHSASIIRNATSVPPFILPRNKTITISNTAGTVKIT